MYFWVAMKEKGEKKAKIREKMDYFVLEPFHLSRVSGQFILNNRLFLWHCFYLSFTRNTKESLTITKQVIQSFLTLKNVWFGPSFVPDCGAVFILCELNHR